MAGFTINKINYANSTGVLQTWRFEYKLWSDPESAYALIGTSSVVAATGVLNTPQTVTGLPSGETYYVRAANTCNSPLEFFVKQITTL
jgi:hypothetical protein